MEAYETASLIRHRKGQLGAIITKVTVTSLAGQWLEKDSANRAMAKLVRREAKGREIARVLTPREIEVVRMVARGMTNLEA